VPDNRWSASTWAYFLLVVGAGGFNYIFVKVGLGFASPLWLALLRAATGAVGAGLIFGILRITPRLDQRGRRDALLLGVPITTVFFALWFYAARSVAPGLVAVLVYTFPLWVALLSVPVLAERVTLRHWSSVGLGFAGVVLISQLGTGMESSIPPDGVVELLVSAAVWAAGTVLFRRRFRASEMLEANVFQLIGGTIGLAILTVALTPTPLPSSRPDLWASVFWIGIVGTAVSNSIWYDLLGRTRAATLSAYLFLVPVIAIAVSAFAFGERLTPYQLCGVILVLVSIYGIGGAAGGSTPPSELSGRLSAKQRPER
jgi:probable blue pigment (indigoidine) exporter